MLDANRHLLGQALDPFRKGLGPYLKRALKQKFGGGWRDRVRDAVKEHAVDAVGQVNWDTQTIVDVLSQYASEIVAPTEVSRLKDLAQRARAARNDWAHERPLTPTATDQHLEALEGLLRFFRLGEAGDIARIRSELMGTSDHVPPSVRARQRVRYELPSVWAEIEGHREGFVGRGSVIREVTEWLHRERGGYLVLTGPPGRGKSALLAQLATLYTTATPEPAVDAGREDSVGCVVHMIKSHKNPARFLQSLLWQAEFLAGEPVPEEDYTGEIDDLRGSLVDALIRVRDRHGKALLLIDALDELDAPARRLSFLPPDLPDGVFAVLSTRPDTAILQRLGRHLRRMNQIAVAPLDPEDLSALLLEHLGPDLLVRSDLGLDWQVVYDRAAGDPLLLRHAISRIAAEIRRADRVGEKPRLLAGDTPNSLEAVFSDLYREAIDVARVPDAGHAHLVLAAFALAHAPLRIEEIRALCADGDTVADRRSTLELLEAMSPFLTRIGDASWFLFHQGMADYICANVLGPDGEVEMHRRYCGVFSTHDVYGRRNAAHHALRWLGLKPESEEAALHLASLISDPRTIAARVEAGEVSEYLADAAAAIEGLARYRALAEEIEVWRRFVGRHADVLRNQPDRLLSFMINEPANSVVARAGDRWLATVGSRGTILRWTNRPTDEVEDGILGRFLQPRGLDDLHVLPDGETLVGLSPDGYLAAWRIRDGEKLWEVEAHRGSSACAITPCGDILTGGVDESVRLWRGGDGELLAERTELGVMITAVDAPENEVFCFGDSTGGVWVWTLSNGRIARLIQGESRVRLVKWDQKTWRLIYGGDEGWSLFSGWKRLIEEPGSAPLPAEDDEVFDSHAYIADVAFLDEDRLIVQVFQQELHWFDPETGHLECRALCRGLEELNDGDYRFSISPDSTLMVTFAPAYANVVDLASERWKFRVACHSPIVAARVVPGNHLLATAEHNGAVTVWDMARCEGVARAEAPAQWEGFLGPDGRALVRTVAGWGSGSSRTEVIDAATGSVIESWPILAEGILQNAEYPAWEVIALDPPAEPAEEDLHDAVPMLTRWQVGPGRTTAVSLVGSRDSFTGAPSLLAVDSGGEMVLLADDDGRLWMADCGTGTCTRLGEVDEPVWMASMAGPRFALGMRDYDTEGKFYSNRIEVWEGETRLAAREGVGFLDCLSLAPGADLLAFSEEGAVQLWRPGEEEPIDLSQASGRVHLLSFSPDGGRLIAAGDDGCLRLYDTGGGGQLAVFDAQAPIVAAEFIGAGGIRCVDRMGRIYDLEIISPAIPTA